MLAAFLLLKKCSWGRFQFTSISLWAGLTDWQSLTKSETGLQVELHMTELLALLEWTDLVTLLLMLWTLQKLLERPGLLTVDGLVSWLILLTLQALLPVLLLEETVLPTFNDLMSLLRLLALQTLRLVAVLEHRGLLTFNGLVN